MVLDLVLVDIILYLVGSVGKNGIIFGADMSSSVHIDNKRKDTLMLGKGPTQRLNHILTAETQYSVNFTRPGIKFCLSLHDNGSSNCLFVNATKIYQFKAKDSETKKYHLRLGSILKSNSHLPKKCFICFNDGPSNMMKNAFYFIFKELFILKIFLFLS